MSKSKTMSIVIPALFTALIAILSPLSILVGSVPFTLSVFAIFLTGALLPPKQAFFATFAYVALGAFGLPIFAGMKGGLGVILDYTGGFIISYPLMTFIIAFVGSIGKKRLSIFLPIGMLLALFICYLLGSIWFMIVLNQTFSYALKVCILPFIPFDLIKIVIATIIAIKARKTIPQLKELHNIN